MSRIEKKTAISAGDAIKAFLKQSRLTPVLNSRRVFDAWDTASGAAAYTVRRFFRDGKLYITLNSSVVRSQLSYQKEALLEKINSILKDDILFDCEDSTTGQVREIVLK